MTNEEAIKNIVAYAYFVDEPVPKEVAKSFDMAIEALKERKTSGWNVITKIPMDADERATWSENLGYEIPDDEAFMYGNLPEEGVDVLVCTMSGTIFIDSLCRDEGCCFEDYGEMDGIVAWRPLPRPYKEANDADS